MSSAEELLKTEKDADMVELLEEEIKTAKVELETNDKEKMDSAFEKLSNVSQEVFAKVYQQAGANGQNPGQDPNANGGEEFHQ